MFEIHSSLLKYVNSQIPIMRSKIEFQKSSMITPCYRLGVVMENLTIIRWIFAPIQAIMSLINTVAFSGILGMLGIYINLFPTFDSRDFYDFDLIWIPISFGALYIILNFSMFIKYIQFSMNLWNLAKKICSRLLKKAAIYQVIQIILSGLIILDSLGLGILLLFPNDPYSDYKIRSDQYGMSYYDPKYNIAGIIILGLIFLILFVCIKIIKILSMLSLDNWAQREKIRNSNDEYLHELSEGTNLMKLSVFLELVSNLFGYLLFNIGLLKAARGFKEFSCQSNENIALIARDKNPIEIQDNSSLQTRDKNPVQTRDNSSLQTRELIKYCPYCGETLN
ncbi:MAG: hypothetical protein ACTSWL_03795 [Promethearchaeota archaeon]